MCASVDEQVKNKLVSLLDEYILTIETIKSDDVWTSDKISGLASHLLSNGATVFQYNPGDVVYRVTNLCNGDIILVEGIVLEISLTYECTETKSRFYFWAKPDKTHTSREYSIWCEFSEFGKTVFKSKEKAEEEIQRRRGQ